MDQDQGCHLPLFSTQGTRDSGMIQGFSQGLRPRREGVPSSHWLSRMCMCMSLHASSSRALWEALEMVCGPTARLGEAEREEQGRGPGMSILLSTRMSLWQPSSPLKIPSCRNPGWGVERPGRARLMFGLFVINGKGWLLGRSLLPSRFS